MVGRPGKVAQRVPLSKPRGVACHRTAERRGIIMRRQAIGFVTGALVLLAIVSPGHAAETSVKAWATWQGQGRFYKATDTLALFSGYFEGVMEVENDQGALDAANMI